MHPDLFEKEGYGWHIGNNPGASMLAAIPYALARPVIDPIVKQTQQKRAAAGLTEPPSLQFTPAHGPRILQRGMAARLDIKFGLAAFVMHALCMAPVSALGAVVMFFLLRRIFQSDKMALWLSLFYAFGTPVFFRTGYLNQNMMLGHFTFMGFVTMWNLGGSDRWSTRTRFFLGGLAGGTALLFRLQRSGVAFGPVLLRLGKAAAGRLAGRCVTSRLLVRVRHLRARSVSFGFISGKVLAIRSIPDSTGCRP